MNGLRLLGHPLHPAVVHFPVAAWTAAVVTALGAMTAGFVDLLAIPAGSEAQRRALRHLYLMGSTWTVSEVDLLLRFLSPAPRPAPPTGRKAGRPGAARSPAPGP